MNSREFVDSTSTFAVKLNWPSRCLAAGSKYSSVRFSWFEVADDEIDIVSNGNDSLGSCWHHPHLRYWHCFAHEVSNVKPAEHNGVLVGSTQASFCRMRWPCSCGIGDGRLCKRVQGCGPHDNKLTGTLSVS